MAYGADLLDGPGFDQTSPPVIWPPTWHLTTPLIFEHPARQASAGVASFSWMHIGGGAADKVVVNFTTGCCSQNKATCLCQLGSNPATTYSRPMTQPCVWTATKPFSVSYPEDSLALRFPPNATYVAGEPIRLSVYVLDALGYVATGSLLTVGAQLLGNCTNLTMAGLPSANGSNGTAAAAAQPAGNGSNATVLSICNRFLFGTPAAPAVQGLASFTDMRLQYIPLAAGAAGFRLNLTAVTAAGRMLSLLSPPFNVTPAAPVRLALDFLTHLLFAGENLTAHLSVWDGYDNRILSATNATVNLTVEAYDPAVGAGLLGAAGVVGARSAAFAAGAFRFGGPGGAGVRLVSSGRFNLRFWWANVSSPIVSVVVVNGPAAVLTARPTLLAVVASEPLSLSSTALDAYGNLATQSLNDWVWLRLGGTDEVLRNLSDTASVGCGAPVVAGSATISHCRAVLPFTNASRFPITYTLEVATLHLRHPSSFRLFIGQVSYDAFRVLKHVVNAPIGKAKGKVLF